MVSFRALRHRNYRLFFLGQIVSLVGTWVQVTALMWLAFRLTDTSLWPALVAAAQMIPAFLLGAWGGVLADRWPRHRLLLFTQTSFMLIAFLLAGLAYAGEESVWHLLAVSLVIGVVNAIDLPARLAFLVEMVGKEDLVNAVGLNSLTFNLARVAGPTLVIWLLPLGGPGLCFLVNALSFLAVLLALARMRLPKQPAANAKPRTRGSIREGFAYVFGHPVLALMLVLTTAVSMCGWPILALLPALADNHLQGEEHASRPPLSALGIGAPPFEQIPLDDSLGYSSLLSALGLGALTAALAVSAFGSVSRRWRFIGAGVVTSSSALVGLSYAPTLTVGMAFSALVGAGLVFFFATMQAVFQLSATDENRGRVMSIYSIILTGAQPLGNLLTGFTADRWGEPAVLRLQGCIILSVGLCILGLYLRTRARKPQDPPADDHPDILPFTPRKTGRLRRAA